MDIEDEGLDIPIINEEKRGTKVLTDEQRKLAIAEARKPHSGRVNIDVRIFIVLGIIVIVGVVLYLFFSNMSKARGLIHKQIIAKTTALTVASQLAPFLPLAQMSPSVSVSPTMHSKAQGGLPAATITAAGQPMLYKMLATVDTFSDMVDKNRADVWVIDRHAWVYADSREPQRAARAATHSRPHFNLYSLTTALPEGQTKAPPNVGDAILQAAEHGPGLVNYLVPAQGVSGAAISAVSVFVQPIPRTDFLVVVKVGHKSDMNAKPIKIPHYAPSAAGAPPTVATTVPPIAPPSSVAATVATTPAASAASAAASLTATNDSTGSGTVSSLLRSMVGIEKGGVTDELLRAATQALR